MNFDINEWCDLFKNLPTEPMTEDLSRAFLACMMGGIDHKKIKEQFLYKVIVGRAEALGLEIEQELIYLLVFLCQSPGDSTMYLSLLKNEQEQGNCANIGNFVMMFPMGFPNRDELSTLWDCQKQSGAECGNALDMNQWG